MKGLMRFGKKGELSAQYGYTYEVLQRIRKITYEMKLPSEWSSVHSGFHVSMLKKSIGGPIYILPIEGLGVNENLSYEVVSVDILDSKVKKLRNKKVAYTKVLQRNHLFEGATLEGDANLMSSYNHLFSPWGYTFFLINRLMNNH